MIARETDGVTRVEDRLRVETGATGGATIPAEPDPWITVKIQAKYFLDADVKGRQIDVDTKNGVVTLKGTVENTQQKQEAEQIARETEGVKRVVNQLTIATAGVR